MHIEERKVTVREITDILRGRWRVIYQDIRKGAYP